MNNFTTPDEFDLLVNKVNETTEPKLNRFEKAMMDAEYEGIENFRKAKEAGQNPKRWRIKVDSSFFESDIRYAVNRYRDAGWKQVNYNYVDKCPGSREPIGEWVITINVDKN